MYSERLVLGLLSDIKSVRDTTINTVLTQVNQEALDSVEEAIFRLARRKDISFHKAVGRVFVYANSPSDAYETVLNLARNNQLLTDVAASQSAIVKVGSLSNRLMGELYRLDPMALLSYQLLGIQMQLYIQVVAMSDKQETTQKVDSTTLGICFNIDKLDNPYRWMYGYGIASWMILFQAVDALDLAGSQLLEGDTDGTLRGIENVYCIAIRNDPKVLAAVQTKLQQSDDFQQNAAVEPFIKDAALLAEPLVMCGTITLQGDISGEDVHNPREALALVKKLKAKETVEAKPDVEKQPLASSAVPTSSLVETEMPPEESTNIEKAPTGTEAVGELQDATASAKDEIEQFLQMLKRDVTFIEGIQGLGNSKHPQAVEEILSQLKNLEYYELDFGLAILDAAANNQDDRMVAVLIAKLITITNPKIKSKIESALLSYRIPPPLKRTQPYHMGRLSLFTPSTARFKTGLSQIEDDYLRLVTELFLIDLGEGFWKEQGGEGFNEDGKNIRVREIGQELHTMDGIDLMQQAHRIVSNELGNSAGSVLESVWRGVENWR